MVSWRVIVVVLLIGLAWFVFRYWPREILQPNENSFCDQFQLVRVQERSALESSITVSRTQGFYAEVLYHVKENHPAEIEGVAVEPSTLWRWHMRIYTESSWRQNKPIEYSEIPHYLVDFQRSLNQLQDKSVRQRQQRHRFGPVSWGTTNNGYDGRGPEPQGLPEPGQQRRWLFFCVPPNVEIGTTFIWEICLLPSAQLRSAVGTRIGPVVVIARGTIVAGE